MKVHLIKRQTVLRYVEYNKAAEMFFAAWLTQLKYVDWSMPSDIIHTFNSADILGKGSNRVIFNIGGNKYRLIAQYFFGKSRVHLYIRWIGTHKDYDLLCKNGEQYTVNKY